MTVLFVCIIVGVTHISCSFRIKWRCVLSQIWFFCIYLCVRFMALVLSSAPMHAKKNTVFFVITVAVGDPNRRIQGFVWHLNYFSNSAHKTYYQITLWNKCFRQNQKLPSDRLFQFLSKYAFFVGVIVKCKILSDTSDFSTWLCYDHSKKDSCINQTCQTEFCISQLLPQKNAYVERNWNHLSEGSFWFCLENLFHNVIW